MSSAGAAGGSHVVKPADKHDSSAGVADSCRSADSTTDGVTKPVHEPAHARGLGLEHVESQLHSLALDKHGQHEHQNAYKAREKVNSLAASATSNRDNIAGPRVTAMSSAFGVADRMVANNVFGGAWPYPPGAMHAPYFMLQYPGAQAAGNQAEHVGPPHASMGVLPGMIPGVWPYPAVGPSPVLLPQYPNAMRPVVAMPGKARGPMHPASVPHALQPPLETHVSDSSGKDETPVSVQKGRSYPPHSRTVQLRPALQFAPKPDMPGKDGSASSQDLSTDRSKLAATKPRGPPALNSRGFPLRPGEQECGYYMKHGTCAFGATCKFHHPEPSSCPVPVVMPYHMPMAPYSMMPQVQYMLPVGAMAPNSGAGYMFPTMVHTPMLPPRPRQR